jgi:hypothetical protein
MISTGVVITAVSRILLRIVDDRRRFKVGAASEMGVAD